MVQRFIQLGSAGSFWWAALPVLAQEAAREKAIAAIKAGGGRVFVDDDKPGKPVTGVSFEYPKKATDALLEQLKAFPELSYLYIDYESKVTDKGLEHLKGLTSLSDLPSGGIPGVLTRGWPIWRA